MTSFNSNYAFEEINNNLPIQKTLLEIYTDQRIPAHEADELLRKVADHKWYISQQLNRDVGFHVAAIDYVENFYRPQTGRRYEGKFTKTINNAVQAIGSAVKTYLKVKGSQLST